MTMTNKNVVMCLLVVVVALGGTVHKVGDSNGWTMMGENYGSWSSSRTFHVGDSLVFEYNKEYHNVNEVTLNNFELCEPSNPLAMYETGSDTITLTKPGVHNFICGFPGHCDIGQKLQIIVLPASLGPIAAPVPGLVRSPSSSLSHSPSPLAYSPAPASQYHMGPAPASQYQMRLAPASQYHMGPAPASPERSYGINILLLLSLLILV